MPKQFVVHVVGRQRRVKSKYVQFWLFRVLELDLVECLRRELLGESIEVTRVNNRVVKRVVKEYPLCKEWADGMAQARFLCARLNQG